MWPIIPTNVAPAPVYANPLHQYYHHHEGTEKKRKPQVDERSNGYVCHPHRDCNHHRCNLSVHPSTKGLPKEGRSLYLATLVVEQACVLTRCLIGSNLSFPSSSMPLWFLIFAVVGYSLPRNQAVGDYGNRFVRGKCDCRYLYPHLCHWPCCLEGAPRHGFNRQFQRFDRWAMKARKSLSEREKKRFYVGRSARSDPQRREATRCSPASSSCPHGTPNALK